MANCSGSSAVVKLASLQVLRAIAAAAVLIFHLGGAIAAEKYFGIQGARTVTSAGKFGVEVFFVLSGFIIAKAHWSQIGSPSFFWGYLLRRAFRLYPLFWVVLGAVCLSGYILITDFGKNFPDTALSWLATLALLPQDPAVVGGSGAPVIIVAWSLQYEVLFYVLFGILILDARVGVLVVFLFVAKLVYSDITGGSWGLSYLRTEYLALFAIGVIAHATSDRVRSNSFASLLAISGAGTLIFLLFHHSVAFASGTLTWSETNGWSWHLFFGVATGALILGMSTLEENGWRVEFRQLEVLGDYSYALYLIHFPIISFVCKAVVSMGVVGVVGSSLAVVGSLSVSLVAAWALFTWVERPAIKYSRQLTGSGNRVGKGSA